MPPLPFVPALGIASLQLAAMPLSLLIDLFLCSWRKQWLQGDQYPWCNRLFQVNGG